MVRFMIVTFAFLGWAFYEMSGGTDFDPDRARTDRSDPLKETETADAAVEERETDVEVTRVSLNLTSVDDVLNRRDETTAGRSQRELRTVQPDDGADNVEIIPSLIENAAPEGAEIVDATNDSRVEQTSLAATADIRVVNGSRVNVRNGPGTTYGIVGTLVKGDRVEVLDDTGTGWVRMRSENGDAMGWMADFLLTEG